MDPQRPAQRRNESHDVRCGGTWTRRQRLKNDVIHLVTRGALALADRLRPGLLLALGRALGIVAHTAFPAARRHAVEQVGLGLSHADAPRLARDSFRFAGESLGLALLLRRQSTSALHWTRVDRTCLGVLDSALALGRGVVFITPHLGPFELIAAALAELGYRPAVVVRESYDPRLDRLVNAHRTGRAVRVIHRGSPTAASAIVRSLKAGRPVGFLPDLGGRVRQTRVALLGCRSDLASGPIALALRTDAPVLVGYLVPRRSGRALGGAGEPPFFELEIVAVRDLIDSQSGAQKVADILSHAITCAPERWLWMAARLHVMAPTRGDRLVQGASCP